jgi:hypothetical protein
MNDMEYGRYGYVTTCRLRYYRTVLFVPVMQRQIDQCKDTYCKGREWFSIHTGKLKGRMPNIAGIYGIVLESEQSAVLRRRRMFSLGRSPLFREQYRLVLTPLLLLVCLGRSVEYGWPQRMHRAQRQKKKCLSVSV